MSRVQVGLSQDLLRLAAAVPRRAPRRNGSRRSGLSGRATSVCTFPKSRTARPARAWASTAKRWRRPGASPARRRTSSRSRATKGGRGAEGGILRRPDRAGGGSGARPFPRADTSLERLAKLQPAFDRAARARSPRATASPLTDGAAGLWVATEAGSQRLPAIDAARPARRLRDGGRRHLPRRAAHGARRRDPAPARAQRPQLRRHRALGDPRSLRGPGALQREGPRRRGVRPEPRRRAPHLRPVPARAGRINPNGGSVALGHPFGATGARILSQAVRELSAMPKGSRAIVSVCADGGLGTVALLET